MHAHRIQTARTRHALNLAWHEWLAAGCGTDRCCIARTRMHYHNTVVGVRVRYLYDTRTTCDMCHCIQNRIDTSYIHNTQTKSKRIFFWKHVHAPCELLHSMACKDDLNSRIDGGSMRGRRFLCDSARILASSLSDVHSKIESLSLGPTVDMDLVASAVLVLPCALCSASLARHRSLFPKLRLAF